MSSWDQVGKQEGRSGVGGRFVQFEDAIAAVMRVLDEEPYITRVHKISQNVKKGDKVEEVFRSIPATDNPDENYILQNNAKRYPDTMQYNLRVAQYKRGEDGKLSAEYELKILQGGPAIFKPLRDIYTEHGSLSQFDISITRKGTKRDTEYTVSAAPFSKPIDVDAARSYLQADEAIGKWENVFPATTAADQLKLIKEAGLDINYDPTAEILKTLTLDKAKEMKLTFGKYKGKSVGELMVIDSGYLSWAAENVTSSDELAAACILGVRGLGGVIETTTAAALPASTEKKKSVAEVVDAAKAADPKERAALLEDINGRFEVDPRYADLEDMVAIVKKHSGGKTRLKDMTVDQLKTLQAEISQPGE